MDETETTTTQRGVYCVLLFNQDMTGVYITLNQGVTQPLTEHGAVKGKAILRERAQRLRIIAGSSINSRSFLLNGDIDLRTDGGVGNDYKFSTAAYKFYPTGAIPDDTNIEADLEALLAGYDHYLSQRTDGTKNGKVTFTVNGQQFSWSKQDVETAFNDTNEGQWRDASGIEPYWHIRVAENSKPVKAVFRNMPGIPNSFDFTTEQAANVFRKLEFPVLDTRPQPALQGLSLIGTSRTMTPSEASRIQQAVASRGGWASWWSFPIREEYRPLLKVPFDMYLNVGGNTIQYRLIVSRYETAGAAGMETPWPEITDADEVGKPRQGPGQNEIYKTWFYVTGMEELRPAISTADFDPAPGLSVNSLLNQASFGYAIRKSMKMAKTPPLMNLGAIHADFAGAVKDAGVTFGDRHDEVTRTFLVSLATKRFVILTGLSGSGKTQIALRFGEWLGPNRYLLSAVRPDWTGGDALFGFEDALQPAVDLKRAWIVTDVLKFILRAARDPEHPYLLILDEMNLAHVERYFADALSGMESGTACVPNLEDSSGEWRAASGEPQVPFPSNLFVVGTVNVDETTYMFSPKVLDRANTIEFRVQTEELDPGLTRPKPARAAPDEIVRGFLVISQDDAWRRSQKSKPNVETVTALTSLHRLLSEAGFEFGHRILFEVLRFADLYELSGDTEHHKALDLQVLQKLLPKLHGSRRKLEPLLNALGHFTHTLSAADSFHAAAAFQPLKAVGDAELPRSFNKIQRMLRSLQANQFVSFVE